jgi:hypothetical protein
VRKMYLAAAKVPGRTGFEQMKDQVANSSFVF